MQPSPTTSLLAGSSPRLRAFTLGVHSALLLGLVTLGACRDPKIVTYDVPKEAVAAHASEAAGSAKDPHAGMNVTAPTGEGMAASTGGITTASGPSLTWTAPAGWQPRQGSSMRKATFAVTGPDGATADLAVTAFPGDVGGDVANVNRWRGQVGLPPLAEAEANASIERLEVNGLKVGIVDIFDPAAKNGVHLIGAMVPFNGATWFFKLLGPDAVVAPQKQAFVEFIKTLKAADAP